MQKRFGKGARDSQVQCHWVAGLCLSPCFGRGRSARALALRGRRGHCLGPAATLGTPKLRPTSFLLASGSPAPRCLLWLPDV
jgi:hypothetical protein